MPKITKKMVDSVKPEAGDVFLWDSELRGFGLRVKPSGKKSFLVQYRNAEGRSRRLTLGAYGPLTVEEGRRLAQQRLGEATTGADPVEERAAKRKTKTMQDLAERYIEEHAEAKKKASSIVNDRQMLRDYILPAFGSLKVDAVTRQDVARLHHEMRDKPFAANRVLALLSKMFNLGEKWGLLPDGSNPCRHVEKYKEDKRKRFLSGEELARLGQALSDAEGREQPSAVLAIRLLLFTGCRLNEILSLQWAHVDLNRGVLALPDSKTGAKLVPLGGPAIEALLNAPRVQENPFVCPGERQGGHFIGIQKPWVRIRTAAGLPDVRIHDLRHSFASVAVAGNLGLPIVGALLGHSQPATTARYAHLGLDPLKAAAEEVSRKISEAMKKK